MLTAKFFAREQQRRDKMVNPEDDSCTVLIHVDVHRACAMYGTRQVASAWQHEVEKAMREINMNPGSALPCTFHKSEVDCTCIFHGDDFVIVTSRRRHSEEVEDHLCSKWDVEVQKNSDQGQRTWRATKIQNEANQRHAVTLTDKKLSSKDRPSSTPGENVDEDASKPELGTQEEIRSCRGDAARGHFPSMDRPDLHFSAKEISRAMSKPT